MRSLGIILVILMLAAAADVGFFDSRYSGTVWADVKKSGQEMNRAVKRPVE